MEKTLINKRFIEAVVYIIKNQRKINKSMIANELGISNSKFSEILKERMNVGVDSIAKICHCYGINPNWILFGKGEISQTVENISQRIPVFNQSELMSFERKDMERCTRKSAISVSDFEKSDFAIRVTSDNLMPAISQNDIAICQLLTKNSYIQWGRPHFVATRQGIMLCQIQSFANDIYTVTFTNPLYGPVSINRVDLLGLAMVVGTIHSF